MSDTGQIDFKPVRQRGDFSAELIFPAPMSEATRSLVAPQLTVALMHADIDVSFAGAGNVMALADNYYDMAIM